MDYKQILSKVDHTMLAADAVWNDIKTLCDDAVEYNAASVCIPPSFVKQAAGYVKKRVKVCTVVGFPNGYNTTRIKVEEAADAVANGADEIDMVINIGMLKEKKYDDILSEIVEIKRVCGNKILKVIIETCLLTEQEKIKMCEIVIKSGAEYIKTSTGFSHKGATDEDIKLIKKHIASNVKIKAAGGIRTIEDAEKFISLGASRIGASKIVASIKEQRSN